MSTIRVGTAHFEHPESRQVLNELVKHFPSSFTFFICRGVNLGYEEKWLQNVEKPERFCFFPELEYTAFRGLMKKCGFHIRLTGTDGVDVAEAILSGGYVINDGFFLFAPAECISNIQMHRIDFFRCVYESGNLPQLCSDIASRVIELRDKPELYTEIVYHNLDVLSPFLDVPTRGREFIDLLKEVAES
jgi:hypothetical protein